MADSTGLQFTVKVGALPESTFVVAEFALEEALNGPFQLRLELASPEPDVDFGAAIKSAKSVVRLGYHGASFDETSAAVKAAGGTFLAASHYLESWSDGRTLSGVYVPVQPMIDPLFATGKLPPAQKRCRNCEEHD